MENIDFEELFTPYVPSEYNIKRREYARRKTVRFGYVIEGQEQDIENYDKAKAADFKGFVLHHRREEQGYTMKQLKEMDLYYRRPANELIFLTCKEHAEIHKTIRSMNKKMTKEDLQRVNEIVSHFEGVVDKIDTDEWKPEWEEDPAIMCNKTLVRNFLMVLYQHNKPYTEEVLTRSIGGFAFNILTRFSVLSPWKEGIYFMSLHKNTMHPNCTFENLREDLLPKEILGLSVEDFIDALEEYGTLEDVCWGENN